jgi:hypothetical protein
VGVLLPPPPLAAPDTPDVPAPDPTVVLMLGGRPRALLPPAATRALLPPAAPRALLPPAAAGVDPAPATEYGSCWRGGRRRALGGRALVPVGRWGGGGNGNATCRFLDKHAGNGNVNGDGGGNGNSQEGMKQASTSMFWAGCDVCLDGTRAAVYIYRAAVALDA